MTTDHESADSHINADADRDERLAALIERLLADARGGTFPDVEQAATEHPDLAAELRELWAVAGLAEEFGSVTVPSAEQDSDDSRNQSSDDLSFEVGELQGRSIGDYELLEELGRGGMGVVYRARQKSLDRIVALKMVFRGGMLAKADLARFRGEAESAARLNHPHIVPVFEVGEHDGLPFFSMQLVEGTTLSQRISGSPLPAREAAQLLAPIAHAIAAAHQQGVLHRDLKPSNILIDTDGRAYVSDFGLAKRITTTSSDDAGAAQLESITQTGAIIGTPGYMSPEQAAGSRGSIGFATDVYGLGAILYAMLTGHPPFQSVSPLDTVLMVLEQEPVPPRLLNPHVDRDLEMIAMKCLQKPIDLRYTSAAAMADDLDAYLVNEPIAARSSHFAQIVSRAFRESHHVTVLENWGLLWILHSAVLLVLCLVTNALQLSQVTTRWPYVGIWTLGLWTWAVIFWNLRRRAGPITFVERQIAHVWAGSMIADTLLYAIEWQMGLDVLKLSPVLGPVSGMVFLVKAGMLSGVFYIQAAALFLTGLAMAWLQEQTAFPYLPNLGLTLFGIVSALCFFLPGWKYYRQRNRNV